MFVTKRLGIGVNVVVLFSFMIIPQLIQAADNETKSTDNSVEQATPAPSDSDKDNPPQPAASQPASNQPTAAQPVANTGGLNLKYKGITINLGGFIEAAGVYRDKNMNSDVATPFQSLPLRNSVGSHQHETRFSARQTRLSLLVQGDYSPQTHLAGYYEMDFLGAATTANSKESNSFNPRIRHLYATVDWDAIGLHILAGQTWSLATLNNNGITPRSEITPIMIDAQYVPGFTWTRQPQARVSWDWDKKIWLAVSVENPQTISVPNDAKDSAINQTFGSNFAANLSSNAVPDIIIKAAFDPGWGHYEIFDMIRVFPSRFVGSNGQYTNMSTTTDAVGAGVILPLVTKMLNFQVSGLWGKGIGRYGSSQLPDVTLNPDGRLIPIEEYQLLAGLKFDPTSDWTFYVYYGREQAKKTAWNDNVAKKGYGYGSSLYITDLGGDPTKFAGQVMSVSQVTAGGWWKFYQGNIGIAQVGLQYSFTDNTYFNGSNGAPYVNNSIVMTSLRYYW